MFSVFQANCICWLDRFTDAKDDLIDVNGGEVHQEEDKVDDEEEEAENHTNSHLEPFIWRGGGIKDRGEEDHNEPG